jgi:hypothetical protein
LFGNLELESVVSTANPGGQIDKFFGLCNALSIIDCSIGSLLCCGIFILTAEAFVQELPGLLLR